MKIVATGKTLLDRALYSFVCLHATFLWPYVVLVPAERTNVFTSLLTLLPLLSLAGGGVWPKASFPWRTVLPWAVLTAGVALSAAMSLAPWPSGLRALSFIAPAVGGLACGQSLFRSEGERRFLFALLTVCFASLVLLHLIFGAAPSFLGLHHHALAGALVLLSAGPIYHAGRGGCAQRCASIVLLLLGAAVCFIAGSRFVILLPFALIPVYLVLKTLSWRNAILMLAASAVTAGLFFVVYPSKALRVENTESTYYRVEAFPATWEIVRHHPLLGIGIRTPREPFLASYTPVSGMTTKEDFLGTLGRNVTWDNQYLSLLCGIGLPLTLLYLFLAGRPLALYLRQAWRHTLDPATERAFTFALLASVIHFAVHDGLYYPQISWFFHLLLGVGVSLTRPAAQADALNAPEQAAAG